MSSFALRLAILPSALLLLLVVGRNKNRRNPTSLLVWLSVLGALSTIPAVIVEIFGAGVLYGFGIYPDTVLYTFIDCFLVVAMIEELGKLAVMLILSWKNKNFDHSYDGVIYGVCSSLGFATLENILYVFRGGIGLGVVRAVSAVPLHCACGVVMGFFYAKARERANRGYGAEAAGNLVIAYISALGIHGLYDFVLSVEDTSIVICIAVLLMAVIIMIVLISHAARYDHIISVQPIWTDPYNFRYMPGRAGVYNSSWQPYGQPGQNSSWQNNGQQPYGQPVQNSSWQNNGQQPYGQPVRNSSWQNNGQQPYGQPVQNSSWQNNGQHPYGQPVQNSSWQNNGQQPYSQYGQNRNL